MWYMELRTEISTAVLSEKTFSQSIVPERYKYVTVKCVFKLYPPLPTSTLIESAHGKLRV